METSDGVARKLSRRSALALIPLLAVGCGSSGLSARVRPPPTPAPTPTPARRVAKSRPRYFVKIGLMGGMDSAYTTDPKTRASVEPWVDVPFASSRILTTPYGELGPSWSELAPWMNRIAILRGVATHTVNHDHGAWQFGRMKARSNRMMPLLLDLIGSERRDSQPLALLQLSPPILHEDTSPHLVSSITDAKGHGSLLDRLQGLDADDLMALSRELRQISGSFDATSEGVATTQNVLQASAFLEALPKAKPFEPRIWSKQAGADSWQVIFQQALWAIDNDLACAIEIHLSGWDSHANNDDVQTAKGTLFASLFARFFEELGRRKNSHGVLLDQTVGVIGSELGRLPRLNARHGKDHLPEAPFLLFGGPRIKAGAFGGTDRRMAGEPVDLDTGEVSRSGDALSIEHVGATMLSLADMDPAVYGYEKPPLRFVEAL